jgi:hypothetical protein
MRIGSDFPPAPAPSSTASTGWGAVLQNPEPVAGSVTHSAPAATPMAPPTPPPMPVPSGPIMSYEQAQLVLQSHGVTWQRLETWGDKGQWKFSCSIPNKQNPAIARNFEARANAPIDAIKAVLDQFGKD